MIVFTLPIAAALFLYFGLGRLQKKKLNAKMRQFRPLKARQLLKIAKDVLCDTNEAMAHLDSPATHPELRALIPILTETRKRVERVVRKHNQQLRLWHAFVHKDLLKVLTDLIEAEDLLRSIPKTKLTLEQVLAGQFDDSSKHMDTVQK